MQGTLKADQAKTPTKHRRHRRRVQQVLRQIDCPTDQDMFDELDDLDLYPKRKERKNAYDREE